jgi:hypothetical protein
MCQELMDDQVLPGLLVQLEQPDHLEQHQELVHLAQLVQLVLQEQVQLVQRAQQVHKELEAIPVQLGPWVYQEKHQGPVPLEQLEQLEKLVQLV